MNAVASRIFCQRCDAYTLHTGEGCCFHPQPRQLAKQPRAPRKLRRAPGRPQSPKDQFGFTAAERQVADLLALGHLKPEIEQRLGLSRNSVASAVRRCKIRMGVDTEGALVRALRWAMVGRSAP